MKSKTMKSPLGEIPTPFNVHDGLFANVDEAKFAIRGVLRAYFGNSSNGEDDYLFFKSAVVRFEKSPQVDLDFDHRRRIIVFVVQEPTGSDAEILKNQIRKQMQLEYAVLAADTRGRTAMTIYRALDGKAKKEIIESERQREKEDEKNK